MASHTERLVLAVAQVAGSTKACARHGDAALLTFPLDRAKDAIHALQYLQARGTALWARLDEQCCVQVKVSAGPVQCGPLGAPGDERYDVVGKALNSLFKAPSSDFYVSPEATPFLT